MTKRDLAIDLGTANTLVYQSGQGIVFDEPTVLAVSRTGHVLAVGREAEERLAGTPGDVLGIRPLQRGAITDFELTREMIRLVLRKVGAGRLAKPRVLVCVPSLLTPVERPDAEDVAG